MWINLLISWFMSFEQKREDVNQEKISKFLENIFNLFYSEKNMVVLPLLYEESFTQNRKSIGLTFQEKMYMPAKYLACDPAFGRFKVSQQLKIQILNGVYSATFISHQRVRLLLSFLISYISQLNANRWLMLLKLAWYRYFESRCFSLQKLLYKSSYTKEKIKTRTAKFD